MNTKKLVRQAMLNADVQGIMHLVEVSDVSFGICHKLLNNNKTCSINSLDKVLKSLGYQLALIRTGETNSSGE